MPQLDDTSTTLPLIIIAVCFALMLIVWLLTLGRKRKTAANDTAITSGTPIVGQSTVTPKQLEQWHLKYGAVVKSWIQNHESMLKKVSEGGLSIDLSSDIGNSHRDLGPAIDEAVAAHPSAPMRSQLSALVLASRNTLDALCRSNWTNAEKFHLSYLQYRDTWLNRLRKFAQSQGAKPPAGTGHAQSPTATPPQTTSPTNTAAGSGSLVPNWTSPDTQ